MTTDVSLLGTRKRRKYDRISIGCGELDQGVDLIDEPAKGTRFLL